MGSDAACGHSRAQSTAFHSRDPPPRWLAYHPDVISRHPGLVGRGVAGRLREIGDVVRRASHRAGSGLRILEVERAPVTAIATEKQVTGMRPLGGLQAVQ